jgi:hypothetical protein
MLNIKGKFTSVGIIRITTFIGWENQIVKWENQNRTWENWA